MPLLDAFLYVPSVNEGVFLQFLVDTGADVSVLHAQDGLRLLTTDDQWAIVKSFHTEYFGGAGADRPYHGVPAVLFLSHEDGSAETREMVIWIAEPGGPNAAHESLFGRDLLSHYTLVFEQPDSLTLSVK